MTVVLCFCCHCENRLLLLKDTIMWFDFYNFLPAHWKFARYPFDQFTLVRQILMDYHEYCCGTLITVDVS